MRHLPKSPADREALLDEIGVASMRYLPKSPADRDGDARRDWRAVD